MGEGAVFCRMGGFCFYMFAPSRKFRRLDFSGYSIRTSTANKAYLASDQRANPQFHRQFSTEAERVFFYIMDGVRFAHEHSIGELFTGSPETFLAALPQRAGPETFPDAILPVADLFHDKQAFFFRLFLILIGVAHRSFLEKAGNWELLLTSFYNQGIDALRYYVEHDAFPPDLGDEW